MSWTPLSQAVEGTGGTNGYLYLLELKWGSEFWLYLISRKIIHAYRVHKFLKRILFSINILADILPFAIYLYYSVLFTMIFWKVLSFNYVYVSICICILYKCLQRPEEDVQSPGAGIVGGYKLRYLGALNWTWVLCKNSTCF